MTDPSNMIKDIIDGFCEETNKHHQSQTHDGSEDGLANVVFLRMDVRSPVFGVLETYFIFI